LRVFLPFLRTVFAYPYYIDFYYTAYASGHVRTSGGGGGGLRHSI